MGTSTSKCKEEYVITPDNYNKLLTQLKNCLKNTTDK